MATVPREQWDRPCQGDIRNKALAALFWCYLGVFLPPETGFGVPFSIFMLAKGQLIENPTPSLHDTFQTPSYFPEEFIKHF